MTTSQGPDCSKGPNCCCDACRHDKLGCVDGTCCRCVPNLLCVTFTPDTPNETCISVYSLFGLETVDYGLYSGSLRNIADKGSIIEIDIEMGTFDDVCAWNVRIPDFSIDEIFEIDGVTVTCENPILDIVIGGDCPGTIHIEPYNLIKVPFQKDETGITEEDFVCGLCTKVCSRLCVVYKIGDETFRRVFEWVPGNSRWESGDDTITPASNGDACELTIVIAGIGDFEPAIMTVCGIGTPAAPMIVEATSDTAVHIAISCNNCSCWDWICDKCRCACDAICLMLQSDYGAPTFKTLEWDNINFRWGDVDYSIGLSKDPITGDCRLNVPGFDPIPTDTCGTGINFSLEDEEGNRAIGRCRNCHCFTKPAECCGSDIYELPLVLVAEVESVADCDCITSTIYLLLDLTGIQWSGTGPGGCAETRISITVACNPGTTCPVGVTVDVCCNPLYPAAHAIQCGFASGFTTDSCSCPPLLLILDEIVIDQACCENQPMAGGVIQITITE